MQLLSASSFPAAELSFVPGVPSFSIFYNASTILSFSFVPQKHAHSAASLTPHIAFFVSFDLRCLFALSSSVLNLSFLQFLLFNRVAAVAMTKWRGKSPEWHDNVLRECKRNKTTTK
jgi:hypothetical protein